MDIFILVLLVFLTIQPVSTLPCDLPTVVLELCACDKLDNGIILDCSNSTGSHVVKVLRENQASIGVIQRLTLQNANLKKLPASFLAGLFIKRLDLSHNQMKEMDENTFGGMRTDLFDLILSNNNLTKIPSKALSSLNTLLRLDLTNNSIGNLSNDDSFPSLHKLYDLNLAGNKICSVHASAFQKVKNSVQIINLGHNCLTSVPSQSIRGLTQLQSLHMHDNNISNLEALSFLNLPVLNLLNLADNKIKEINRQAFLNVPNIRYLYLTGNKINKLAVNQFTSFEKMEMLALNKNQIKVLPTGSLSQLLSLRELYLDNNKISKIEKDAFKDSNIKILVLSNNELSELPEGIVSGMPVLQQVQFKSNQIKEIHQNAFYNASSVAAIDLSDNEISEIAPSTFMAQLNLLSVDLSHNKLSRTPYSAFNRRVGIVLLGENPLVCTEKVHMIQNGVGVFIPNSEDIICGGTPSTTSPRPVTTPSTDLELPSSVVIKPHGAFQQHDIRKIPSTSDEPELLPTRPSILNVRPTNVVVTRSRGLHGSDIAPQLTTAVTPQEEKEEEQQEQQEQESTEEDKVDLLQPEVELAPIEPIAPEEPVKSTSTLGPRVYTDIADNPNLIHPFPVPFLKRGPGMHQAIRIKATTPVSVADEIHTLPPSIVIAPRTRPMSAEVPDNNSVESKNFEQFALQSESDKEKEMEPRPRSGLNKISSPTIIIIVCLITVAVVMVAVFIGLCIARHRQASRFTSYSDSSAARTNAYVASQSAHMNMVYGSMGRDRTMTIGREDAQPWVYNPGPNYCNYYK